MTAQIDIIDYLTDIERSRLAELEAIIDRGKRAFMEVADALMEIMQGKLYRETHTTFEGYCSDVLGISRRRAYQLVEGARNVQTIAQEGLVPPVFDSTARELSPLPEEQRALAWEWCQNISQREQPPASLVKTIVADVLSGDPAIYEVQRLKREYRAVAWAIMLQFVDEPDAATMKMVVEVFIRDVAPEDVDLVEYYTAKVNLHMDSVEQASQWQKVLSMAQVVSGLDDPPENVTEQVRWLMGCVPSLGEALGGIPKGMKALVWTIALMIYNTPNTLGIQWVAGHIRREEVATSAPREWTAQQWHDHLLELMDEEETKPKKSAIESGYSEEQEKSLPAPDRPKDLEDVPEETGGELDRDAWCTPVWFIEEVVRPWLWGTIELDPCSNPHAQEKIGANVAYFEEHDGLERDWHGKGFMNPPYSQPKVTKFCEKLAKHHTEGDVPMAVAIINSTTDTNAYHALAKTARFEAHPNRRINFWHRDTTSEDYNRHKQTVFFFGDGDTSVIGELLNKGWSIKQRIDYGQDGDSAWAIRELVMAREALGVDPETDISLWRVIKCLMVHLDQHGITFDPDGFADQEESDGNDASMDHHFERAERLLGGE
jgi:hypothetical protein